MWSCFNSCTVSGTLLHVQDIKSEWISMCYQVLRITTVVADTGSHRAVLF